MKHILAIAFCLLSVGQAVGQDNSHGMMGVPKKPTSHIAIKTNLLYDIAAIPNISAELQLRRNWSVGLGYWHAWWSSDPSHRYWRTYGGELYARKYIGTAAKRSPLSSHHLGVIGQAGTYDFEFGGTGYLSRFSYSAGVEYGYSFPVSKKINIDISTALGYIGGKYNVYKPIDTHYVWQHDGHLNWIGPTKAEVSLVLQLGRNGDSSKKKGGDR